MARSNGPFGPAGTRPQARRHPDDAFAPPPPGQPNGHWPPAPPAQHGQGYHFPPEPDANYGYQQQAAPYDAYQGGQQPDPYAPQQWGQPDPRGYDLGNYMPNGGQQPYPQGDPPPFAQGAHHDPYAQQGYGDAEPEYEDEFADEEPSGRGRRWMFIVAALVGAVGVGGALAYTYKSFVAPNGGRVPLVKADPNVKVRPDSRNAAANDKRMQGRLGEDAGQKNAAAETQDDRAGNDESGGPRRVRTIPITPGGGPPAGIQIAPAAQAAPPPTVPGIMLENMGPRGQPPPQRAAPPQQPPQRVTIGQPPPQVAPQEDPPAPPARRAPTPPAQVAKAPQAPKAAPPPAANTGAGYVAVLSSQKSRMDALKVFADLQQKYGDALSGKTPDVQEADLSARGLGTVYRLVVGPPGSRDAASGICSQIKAAGHKDCWVTAY
jgi:hypothetical protein